MTAVEVEGVDAAYGDVEVLRAVSLDAPSGLLTGVLGPSGCGKSTLVRVIAGFHRPTGGTVRIGGRAVDGPDGFVPPERRRVGIVPQDVALFPHLTVAQNVGYGTRRGLRRRPDEAVVQRALTLVALPDAGPLRPDQLSGGQQQRVAVARALAADPDVVLLDEPFGSLDPSLREQVRAQVRSALRASGSTALLVTHDQEEALSLCDRVVVLRDGRVVQSGTPEQVYREPDSLWGARFVGDLVELSPHSAVCEGRVDTALGCLPVSAVITDPESAAGVGVAPVVTVRPEQVVLDPASGVSAVVVDVTYFGHDALIGLRVEGDAPAEGVRVVSRVTGVRPPAVADRVRVSVQGAARAYTS
ncbi:MAG: ABC transporter ATP-binding protein [Candidatus Nanopelagicales bacterium]